MSTMLLALVCLSTLTYAAPMRSGVAKTRGSPRTFAVRPTMLKKSALRNAAAHSRVTDKSVDTYKLPPKSEKAKSKFAKALAATAAVSAAVPGIALAKGGEFGALEGGVPALVHPVMMGGLYMTTLYTGFLGWQIRKMRTLADDISALKKQAPQLTTPGKTFASPVGPLIESLKSELSSADDSTKKTLQADISSLQAFATVDAELQNLTTERKNLVKGDFRDRHFQLSSLLLALGVGFAIEGPVNTWMRTGKLFPGPHLFAGAGLTVLWAAAAGLVPAMQKGNKFAKDMHIALNAAGLGLFSWQILSGIPILKKVLEFKFGIKL
mmetsp:Transcript_46642/g.75018  ORF Transcript_46642/g.75018 Transcript_46642/m.75018 type:complete len:324 (-) Transcript_46642:192-1163(-)